MKKQEKRSKKKHLLKEVFKKIRYKQLICGGYINIRERIKIVKFRKKHINAATNEVRKSKRHFAHKLTQHIKSDSKSFCVCNK